MTNVFCTSIFLTSHPIVVLSVIALMTLLTAQHVKHKGIAVAMYAANFLCVIACITFALLLGAELKDTLIYILLFAFASLIGFVSERKEPCDNKENAPKESAENEPNGNAAKAAQTSDQDADEKEIGGERQ